MPINVAYNANAGRKIDLKLKILLLCCRLTMASCPISIHFKSSIRENSTDYGTAVERRRSGHFLALQIILIDAEACQFRDEGAIHDFLDARPNDGGRAHRAGFGSGVEG